MWGALAAAFVLGSSSTLATQPSRIVFASSRTGVSQLYSVEPNGKGLAQLTFGAGGWQQRQPSPNGSYVAALRRSELWVMRADGSGARLVASNVDSSEGNMTALSWSGNSRRLAYRGSDWNIWSVADAGGPPQRLSRGSDAGWPSLSPDGRSVAFVHYGKPGIRLVVLRNRHEHVVARSVNGFPVWSPDGRSIAIQDNPVLYLFRPVGRLQRAFPMRGWSNCTTDCVPPPLAWSHDSRRVAYVEGDGIHVVRRSGSEVLAVAVKGPVRGLAFSPGGNTLAVATTAGIGTGALDGEVRILVPFGLGEAQPGIGWTLAPSGGSYRPPEDASLVRVSARQLKARVPITKLSADGDRVAYWLCPHSLGAWRPGDAQPLALGGSTLGACSVPPALVGFGIYVYDLALAGNRLAYLSEWDGNEIHTALMLTTLGRGTEGDMITETETSRDLPIALGDLVGGGSTLVYGWRSSFVTSLPAPESIWRVDGATPVQITKSTDDLQPLSVDRGRIVARRADGSLELLDVEGGVLRTFDVHALGAVLAGDDLVVLVQGQLRDYSASSGALLETWPLPDVPSAGRCRDLACPGVRLTLDDAARGVAVYTLDGVVHLLRLRDGEDKTVPGATAAELTDAGLFYAYVGADPWPGRIRFVPFDELPLR
jgi:WD40-like Beta Propeller Repeat